MNCAAKTVLGLILGFFLGFPALFASAVPAHAQGGPSTVFVDLVIDEPLTQTSPVLGRLVARQRGVVAALTRGPVNEVTVDAGDRVAAGDIILRIAMDRISQTRNLAAAQVQLARAQVTTAKAELDLANQELARLERLRQSSAFSPARYDDQANTVQTKISEVGEAEASVAAAIADLRIAEIDVRLAEVRAPYDGVIIERHTQRGAYLNVGDPVVTMINDQDLEIAAEVPSNRTAGLLPGRSVQVSLGPGHTVDAFVRAVIPEENALTRTRAVRFTPALDELLSKGDVPLAANQTVTVNVPVSTIRDVISVHKDAVIPRGDANMVFVVEDGKAQPRPVKLDGAIGNRFIVLEGLKVGDMTVIRGNERLRPGEDVTVGNAPDNGKAS
ncbi:efflux RND transporter periplasmic adaptor subunit [Hwanghaeella grinnelliae]|uniref:Efflux RND transporter periplasmic adaptor subunit n=1 Tax=Hwanghaeella grinnelliae TaxID=2500179 RepID=A0A3S2W2X2_9PROT|nr:efflux RND transporter periplasmic adaptor subunit [Hwanghaeella grinnelliae]RVU34739.1 efflux RND transporter periplasmic adaptor subunit [Hwanghaeella grinnelliae]